MRTIITHTLPKIVIVAAIVAAALGTSYLYANWTPPTANPPADNVDAPLNTGNITQIKDAGLNLLSLIVNGPVQILSGSLRLDLNNSTVEKGHVLIANDDQGNVAWVATSSLGIVGDGGTGVGTGNTTIIRKTADQTETGVPVDPTTPNSLVLQDDDHLVFPMKANTTYHFELVAIYRQDSFQGTPTIGWCIPTPPPEPDQPIICGDGGSSGSMQWGTGPSPIKTVNGTLSFSPNLFDNPFAAEIQLGTVEGYVYNGSAPGDLQLRWSPSAYEQGSILKNSILIVHELGPNL